MNSPKVVFIAFQKFDNLGIGYLSSLLAEKGYQSLLINFQDKKEEILKTLKCVKPLIAGFSVIFQSHIYEFRDLIIYLRKNGIKCHFTAGGHYASLRYDELFDIIPELDSAVRFEGEYTFLDLTQSIYQGKEWRNVKSIAYRSNGKTIVNKLRPLEKDLDKFPLPLREPLKEYALNKKFGTILAGRGCIHDCAFCDIRKFYQQPPGPNKRLRRPEKVVEEMEFLHREKNCSVFLFQDDDFPVKTEKGPEWIERFCFELHRKNLDENIMWKINCRPDEVDLKSFEMMKDHGLYLLFLGIEDGTDSGLNRLNKHMTVAKSLEGISTLKKLNIGFDFGFMLFQPYSSRQTVEENLGFLRVIVGDGFSPVTFLKTLPYFETRIEKELKSSGRLKGKPGFLDYDFPDTYMDRYYDFTTNCLMEWLRDPDGLLNVTRWARNYLSVFSRYFKVTPEIQLLQSKITTIVSESNLFLLDNMQELLVRFEEKKYTGKYFAGLESIKQNIKIQHDRYKNSIRESISGLVNTVMIQELFHVVPLRS
jgi:anaerobic magnesium-protoporphyrin IX monomethyl ester cyclase